MSHPIRRFCLAVAAAVLAPTLLAPVTASAAAVPFGSGSLDWGVKAGLRDYLASPGTGGVITPTDTATANGDGTFHFPFGKADYDTATHAVTSSFAGGLHITGHNGQLDITLTNLRVTTSGKTGTLSADTSSKQMDGNAFTAKELPLVTFPVAQDSFSGAPVATVLTEQGVKAFGGFYPAATAMDPVKVVLSQGSQGAAGSSGSGSASAPATGQPSSAQSSSAGASGSSNASGSSSATSSSGSSNASGPSNASGASSASGAATPVAASAPAESKSSSSATPIVLVILGVVVIGGVGYFVWRRRGPRQT